MMKIMVVDDERDVESLFKQKFKKELRDGTIAFHFAFSGEEAIEYLRQADVADVVLILSDINMPGISGIELLRLIKSDFSHLSVFMITAYEDQEYYRKAITYGADDYLLKPIDFNRLKTEIFKFVQKAE